MTGPRPINTRPVILSDLTVLGHQPSAIEEVFRQMTMSPEDRAAAQAAFRVRRAQFAHDYPRALPSGVPAAIGGLGTDVASVDLPFLPPAFPAVRAKGDELTQHLVGYLQRLFGAPAGTEGTQAGTEMGSMLTASVAPEAIGSILERIAPFLRTAIPEDPGMLRPGEGARWMPGKDYQLPERLTNHDLAGNAYLTSGRVTSEPWNAPIAPQFIPPRPIRPPMTPAQVDQYAGSLFPRR